MGYPAYPDQRALEEHRDLRVHQGCPEPWGQQGELGQMDLQEDPDLQELTGEPVPQVNPGKAAQRGHQDHLESKATAAPQVSLELVECPVNQVG